MSTLSWTPGLSGDWSTAADWSGSVVPADPGTSAALGGTGAYAVSLAATESYSIGGLSITDTTASLTVKGGLSVTTLANSGVIKLTGAATALVASGAVTDLGRITVSDSAAFWLDPGSSLANGGKITLNTAGTLGIDSVIKLGALNHVTNSGGLVEVYGSGTLNLGGAVAVSGTVGLLSNLALDGGTLLKGTLENTGGSVALYGTLDAMTWQGPMIIGAMQSMTVTGGLTVTTAQSTPGTITLAGGRFDVADSETLNGMTLLAAPTAANADFIENATQQDGSPSGTVTFGSTFVLSQTGGVTYLQDPSGGGTATTTVNAGQMLISSGTLVLKEGSLNNTGTLAIGAAAFVSVTSYTTVSSSGLIDANGGGLSQLNFGINTVATELTNLVGSVYTGGTLEADANSTLDIDASSKLTVANTTLILNGANSAIRFYDPTLARDDDIRTTLVTLNGMLVLSNGANFVATQSLVDNGLMTLNGGTLAVSTFTVSAGAALSGNGMVNDQKNSTLANNGTVTASGGMLDLTGSVSGTGQLVIAADATLEIADNDTNTIAFAGLGELMLGNVTPIAGTISDIVAGDTLFLSRVAGTAVTFAGGLLTVTVPHFGPYVFDASGAAGLTTSIAQDGLGDSIITFAAGALALAPMRFAASAAATSVAPVTPLPLTLALAFSEPPWPAGTNAPVAWAASAEPVAGASDFLSGTDHTLELPFAHTHGATS
jgi:hypothetical protein